MTTLPVWEHWDAMIAVSHGVLGSVDEARDCAAEAMAQVLERDPADVANLEAFMVTVAKRRAIDRVRAAQRARRRDVILAGQSPLSAPDVAEDVAARAEARWADEQARVLLKPRVYRLVRMLADGAPMQEAAQQLGMTQRAAESHLLRARRTMRTALAKTFGAIVGVLACGRRYAPAAPAIALAAVSLAVHGGLVPSAPDRQLLPPHAGTRTMSPAAVALVPAPEPKPQPGTQAKRGRPASALVVAARPTPPPPELSPLAHTPAARLDTYDSEDGNRSANPIEQAVNCVRNLRVTTSYAGCEAQPQGEGQGAAG